MSAKTKVSENFLEMLRKAEKNSEVIRVAKRLMVDECYRSGWELVVPVFINKRSTKGNLKGRFFTLSYALTVEIDFYWQSLEESPRIRFEYRCKPKRKEEESHRNAWNRVIFVDRRFDKKDWKSFVKPILSLEESFKKK
jgi:hypothetical protein